MSLVERNHIVYPTFEVFRCDFQIANSFSATSSANLFGESDITFSDSAFLTPFLYKFIIYPIQSRQDLGIITRSAPLPVRVYPFFSLIDTSAQLRSVLLGFRAANFTKSYGTSIITNPYSTSIPYEFKFLPQEFLRNSPFRVVTQVSFTNETTSSFTSTLFDWHIDFYFLKDQNEVSLYI